MSARIPVTIAFVGEEGSSPATVEVYRRDGRVVLKFTSADERDGSSALLVEMSGSSAFELSAAVYLAAGLLPLAEASESA